MIIFRGNTATDDNVVQKQFLEKIDLEGEKENCEGGGGTFLLNNGIVNGQKNTADMSLCLDATNVLTTSVGTTHSATLNNVATLNTSVAPHTITLNNAANTISAEKVDGQEKSPMVAKNVSKIIVANPQTSVTPSQMKIVSSPLITVMNTAGPITVVKSSLGNNSASHITLVNSAPLTVKPQTITVVNAQPITVVKAISSATTIEKSTDNTNVNNGNLAVAGNISDKTLHNVFVKKSTISEQDMPQSHKLLTANSFPSTNLIQTGPAPLLKTVNGQRPPAGSKVKILSNVVMNPMPGTSNITYVNKDSSINSNTVINKPSQRFYPQKNVGNGTTKYLNKQLNNIPTKQVPPKQVEKLSQKIVYAGPKNQIKTLPTLSSFTTKPMKALSPQSKVNPPISKSGVSPRFPQQRQKLPTKPNYIGKHAVQAQKLKPPITKKVKPSTFPQYQNRPNTVTFNQALTAQILETLGTKSSYEQTRYDVPRFEPTYNFQEVRPPPEQRPSPMEYKPQSNLDTLSFVCQAVLLDHNYNATLPMDSPVPASSSIPSQINGANPMYSPGTSKRRNLTPSNTLSSLSSCSLIPSVPSQDDDAASDISCRSDRKPESEGEETDTAPEAEAVANEDQYGDRYGDYVTRCICGFIHDDGYMIECDICKVWQHVRCVIRSKKVPDDYKCEECDPCKPIDRQKARTLQQQWMREVQEREAKLRKEQMKEVTDTDSSDAEASNNNLKGRKKTDVKKRREREKRQLKRKITKRKVRSQSKTSDDERHLPQFRQWIDNYEEAVTNHYSPELRARISSIRINGAHSELIGQVDAQLQKCKLQCNANGAKHLLTTCNMSSGTPVIELRGKYMLSTQHRTSTHFSNLTTRQQRPGPFLFFYRLHRDNTEVCVDTRTYGNIARFIRRSCQPNAELRHCIEKGVLHLYVVVTSAVDKNVELTIKHESHDLAAVGTADVACACDNSETCSLKCRKNGDVLEVNHRKRRGRRTSSISETKIKEEEKEIVPEIKVKEEIKEEVAEEEIKVEEVEKEEVEVKCEKEIKKDIKKDEETPDVPTPQIPPRRSSSQHKSDHEEKKESPQAEEKDKKKLSREERKLQAIMKAIERMEKQEQRKQEHQAKQAHRRESEPTPTKEEEKSACRGKRRKRKGRTRTLSTNSQGRRNRLNSADSTHATSSDETLLSPNDQTVEPNSPRKAAGLLLAFSNGENEKSPEHMRDIDSNSNSSPETPLSSACLLVAAAVEPLEPGFKFPKTKKGLMNEWLNKGPDMSTPSPISPSLNASEVFDTGYYTPTKNLQALAQAATFCDTSQPHGSAKKRWLRQAISEDQCDSPNSRPESPPTAETLAPPKKRRLPRESLSTESRKDDEDVIQQENEPIEIEPMSEFAEIKHSYKLESHEFARKEFGSLLDPRLCRERHLFANSDHLVGTVEKTLSFLGFEDKKPESKTPAKRKLSINEYRQRKKLNTNDKQEDCAVEENTASQSPKALRNRSNSSTSTSCPTSDEEMSAAELPAPKVLSAFNSEPTELERQRENVSLRLKKALGMSIDDEVRKPAINVETILKCDLPSPPKASLSLPCPTFPIPGASEIPTETTSANLCQTKMETASMPEDAEPKEAVDEDIRAVKSSDPVLYYTPDEEEMEVGEEKIDSTSYVPPFNNPLYPNSNYTNYGSVIDDDAPYEGRNPSPPPNLDLQ